MKPLSLRIDHEPLSRHHYLHVYAEGEMTDGTVQRLEDALQFCIEDSTTGVVVDLSEVTRIDTRALGILLSLMNRMDRKQILFFLKGVNERIGPMFRDTCCDSIFHCVHSEEEIRVCCENHMAGGESILPMRMP